MIPHNFTKYLSPLAYNKLPTKGPLMFRHVSARVFPLRANLDILQQLCDSYLNIVPPEAGYFRVPLPYVNLVVLDYGQMGEKEMRVGWFSQVEVYFGMAVEWYKLVDGQWVFYDWAVITPYIFVSDSVSVPTGRCVYGFPKILSKVELNASGWVKNPISPTTLARISTKLFPETYIGGSLEERVFLEIDQAALTNFRVPIDPTCPNMPWMVASSLAETVGGLGRDAMWLAQSMRISSINPFVGPGFLQAMGSRLQPGFDPGGHGVLLNSINLKQFRREDDPTHVCYRSLTNGHMQTTGFNGAGLLGENHIFLGDLTGGHTVRLYEHATLPIAETLGLEMNRSWTDQGVQVGEFKPVLPFWTDVDLKYDMGTNVAWQNEDGIWKDGGGVPFGTGNTDSAYNNTVSTSIEAIAGPFRFTDTTIRVIPLLADKKKLQAFLDEYINGALHGPILQENGAVERFEFRFQLWARGPQAIDKGDPINGLYTSVFLTASSFKDVISSTNNIGDWAQFELAFMIPVKWQRRPVGAAPTPGPKTGDSDGWTTIGVGLVPAFTMVDNNITAFSRLEIQGIPAVTAQFIRPESVWLSDEGGAHPQQTLLRVNVELVAALGAGQNAAFHPVIKVITDDPEQGLGYAPGSATNWAKILLKELAMKKAAKQQYFEELKIARALSLELLTSNAPFSLYTLKQFPDVADSNKACFQSLVRIGRTLAEVTEIEEVEETLAVRIFGYPSFDIVEALGIHAVRLEERAAGIVYSIQGLRPYFIRATVDEQLGESLMSRSGLAPWTIHPVTYKTMLSGEPNATPIVVDRMAETLQDQIDPSRTVATMYECEQRWLNHKVPEWNKITPDQARAALDRMDPQIVIESILSREWSNFNSDARWRKGKQTLMDGFAALPQDGELKSYAEAELYRQINNSLAAPPGAVAGNISLQDMQDTSDYLWLNPAMFRAMCKAAVQQELFQFIEAFIAEQPWMGLCFTPVLLGGLVDPLPLIEGIWRSLVEENLRGQGAAHRWRREMKDIILREQEFTTLRYKMERCIDLLSPLAILGFRRLQAAYAKINKAGQENPSTPPTAEKLRELGNELFAVIDSLLGTRVKGEPSTHNNLDPVALANEERLRTLLAAVKAELQDETKAEIRDETEAKLPDKTKPGPMYETKAALEDEAKTEFQDEPKPELPEDTKAELPPEADQGALNETQLSMLMTHTAEEGGIVSLARAKCQLQFEALLNKLSRAYQKPDFCLRRDAFSCDDRDRLLPIALSWDENWYYGEDISLDEKLANEAITGVPGYDEKRSSPAKSPPAGESQPPVPSVPQTAASETHPQSAG